MCMQRSLTTGLISEPVRVNKFPGSERLFPEDLRSRERTHLVFGTQVGVERGHKTMGNSMFDYIKQ